MNWIPALDENIFICLNDSFDVSSINILMRMILLGVKYLSNPDVYTEDHQRGPLKEVPEFVMATQNILMRLTIESNVDYLFPIIL